MESIEADLTECLDAVFKTSSRQVYNSAIGFFQGYTPAESDSMGVRYAIVKLHYKDDDGGDISVACPLLQIGSKNCIVDYRLEPGKDEILVLFLDRTLEQWKDSSGTVPQSLVNKVKDSINHAVGIPIVSHHYSGGVITGAIDSTVGAFFGVKQGKKVQVGTEADELLKILYGIFSIIKTWTDSGSGSWNGSSINALVAQLANITKV